MTERATIGGSRGDAVIHPLRIGTVELSNNLVLAPMAGVCDLPFRMLCKEQGAGLLCMEMVSAKALQYNNQNTRRLMETCEEERPVSLQLFGSDPDCISTQAKRIEGAAFDILDINMGCPVPKVVKNGDGSALMKHPRLAGEIIEKTVQAIQKPVTVKIRAGFDETHKNAVELAHIAQESGAVAITVHGRTREQYYSGRADWDIIAQVVERVDIPVIGNGDLRCGEDVERMARQTGCAGFAIGRGAQGNPWIFRQILQYFETGERIGKPPIEEMVDTMLAHTRRQIEAKGEVAGIREMRKHIAWYTAGYPGSSRLRGSINEVETYPQLKEVFDAFVQTGTNEP